MSGSCNFAMNENDVPVFDDLPKLGSSLPISVKESLIILYTKIHPHKEHFIISRNLGFHKINQPWETSYTK